MRSGAAEVSAGVQLQANRAQLQASREELEGSRAQLAALLDDRLQEGQDEPKTCVVPSTRRPTLRSSRAATCACAAAARSPYSWQPTPLPSRRGG